MVYDTVGFLPNWLAKIIEGISYKPGFSLFVTAREDGMNLNHLEPWAYTINARCIVKDIATKSEFTLHGPGITVYRDRMEERMVVHMIFSIIRALECHEMEEQFNYNGIRIFDPHRSNAEQEKLYELAATHPEFEPKAMALIQSPLRMTMMLNGLEGVSIPLGAINE